MYRRLLTHLRKPFLWLMVPMVLLVGRPAAGCVCADGTIKSVCCKSEPILSAFECPSGKGCCEHSFACSHCSQDSSRDSSEEICLKNATCGCHSLPNHIDAARVTDLRTEAWFFGLATLPPVVDVVRETSGGYRSSDLHADLPAIDRVVVFLHLTI